MRKGRKLTAAGLAVIIFGVGSAVPALAATGPETVDASDSVTDYAGYPANEVPNAECDASDVQGVVFTRNGGDPTGDLGSYGDLAAGDEIAASWTGINAECDEVVISIALKEAETATFDPADDQALVSPYARATLRLDQDGGGSVRLDLPVTRTCFYQVDLVLGRPLMVVGPSGNFYSSRGPLGGSDSRDMLLGFNNGTQGNCTVDQTTTTTAPETTTTVPATTTTEPPTLTVPPPEPPPTTAPPAPPTTSSSGTSVSTAPPRSIPVTGADSTPWLAGMSALLLSVGTALAVNGRRLARRSA
jgi:hypothetical protein